MWYQWWSRDRCWRTLYHLSSLRDVFAGGKGPHGPWVYLPSPSSGPLIWQAPFSRALLHLQDNKQHHVWLVSEFSGLEHSICIGCCCAVNPVCLTTVAEALRKQKPTVRYAGGPTYSVNKPELAMLWRQYVVPADSLKLTIWKVHIYLFLNCDI